MVYDTYMMLFFKVPYKSPCAIQPLSKHQKNPVEATGSGSFWRSRITNHPPVGGPLVSRPFQARPGPATKRQWASRASTETNPWLKVEQIYETIVCS